LLAHDWWFCPGTPVSFTTKAGRHDIAEILLKVALKHQKSKIKLIKIRCLLHLFFTNLKSTTTSEGSELKKDGKCGY
jgi:hypothetical protein